MRLEFYYSSEHEPSDIPENKGFDLDSILQRLESLEEHEQFSCRVVDTSKLSDSDLFDVYTRASLPAVWKGRTGYSVSRVFGTRRSKGIFFGREVPALLVYEEESQHPTDIYPHRMGQRSITIKEFLESLY